MMEEKQSMELTFKNNLHENIKNNIIKMLGIWDLRYFGEFSVRLKYIKKLDEKFTCAVNVSMNGPNFYWGEDFVNKLTQKACAFVQIHECCHLLFHHPKRGMSYDKLASNYVMDMIINQIIRDKMLMCGTNNLHIEEPKDEKGENTCLYVPKEYDGALFFEELYVWWMKQVERRKKEREEKGISSEFNIKMPNGNVIHVPGSKGDGEEDDVENGGEKPDSRSYGKNGLNGAETHSLNDVLRLNILFIFIY